MVWIVFLKKVCPFPSLWNLWMWYYLEKVFANVIKFRISICDHHAFIFLRENWNKTREEGCVVWRQIEAVHLQPKEHQELLDSYWEVRKKHGIYSPSDLLGGTKSSDSLIWDSALHNREEINVFSLQATQFVFITVALGK